MRGNKLLRRTLHFSLLAAAVGLGFAIILGAFTQSEADVAFEGTVESLSLSPQSVVRRQEGLITLVPQTLTLRTSDVVANAAIIEGAWPESALGKGCQKLAPKFGNAVAAFHLSPAQRLELYLVPGQMVTMLPGSKVSFSPGVYEKLPFIAHAYSVGFVLQSPQRALLWQLQPGEGLKEDLKIEVEGGTVGVKDAFECEPGQPDRHSFLAGFSRPFLGEGIKAPPVAPIVGLRVKIQIPVSKAAGTSVPVESEEPDLARISHEGCAE